MTKGTYFSLRGSIARLTRDSDHFVPTFKAVVEHIHSLVLNKGRRHRHAVKALEILVTLVKKTPAALIDAPLPLVDGAWITQLLRSAAESMDDEKFTLFMRLSAQRKEEEAVPDGKTPTDARTGGTTYPPSHGGNIPSETPVATHTFFKKIISNLRTCTQTEGGWQDEAVFGGLIAIKDIPGLETCHPSLGSLQILSEAMENKERKPFRVRKAAYDVMLAARDGWFKSADLRKTLEDLDIPRKLHSVVIETGRTDDQHSFLEMMEILAENREWHSYLRKAMDIWLPLHHEGPGYVQRILIAIGELIVPGSEGLKPPHDKPLEKLVEEEWAGVPGRLVQDLTADRLNSLAEATAQFKRQLPADRDSDRRVILSVVEKVVPSLEKRNDIPKEDIRKIIDELIEVLRLPTAQSRSGHW